MVRTDLLTRTGDFVATVELPPTALPIEVICWGIRLFVRNSAGQYREGVVWVAPEAVPHAVR